MSSRKNTVYITGAAREALIRRVYAIDEYEGNQQNLN